MGCDSFVVSKMEAVKIKANQDNLTLKFKAVIHVARFVPHGKSSAILLHVGTTDIMCKNSIY